MPRRSRNHSVPAPSPSPDRAISSKGTAVSMRNWNADLMTSRPDHPCVLPGSPSWLHDVHCLDTMVLPQTPPQRLDVRPCGRTPLFEHAQKLWLPSGNPQPTPRLETPPRQTRAADVRQGTLAARPLELQHRHRPQRPARLPATALPRPAHPSPGPRGGSQTQTRIGAGGPSFPQVAPQRAAHIRRTARGCPASGPALGASGTVDRAIPRSADADVLTRSGRTGYDATR